MRTFFMGMVLAACAAGAVQTVATSRHKVAWGWGCGGNCAVNFSGESETTLANDPPGVHLEDHGTLTRRENSPGGAVITETRWRYAFHGTGTAGGQRREFTLHTDASECTRQDKTLDQAGSATVKTASCPGPPRRWKLVCERQQVQVKEQPRPAWVCSPAPPMDPFGTDFPWVFGIEGPITTVVSGEPRPHTRYE